MTADPNLTEAGFELFFTYCSINVVMMTAAVFLLVQKALERLLIRFVHGRAFQQKAQPRHLPAQGAAQRVIGIFKG